MVALNCRCQYPDCWDDSVVGTCTIQPGGKCFTYVEEINNGNGTYSLEKRFGCFKPGDDSLFQCKGYLPNHDVFKNISCCNDVDYCNEKLMTDIIDGQIVYEENIFSFEELGKWISVFICAFLMLVLVFTFAILLFKKISKSMINAKEKLEKCIEDHETISNKCLLDYPLPNISAIEPAFDFLNEEDSSMGARPMLVTKTYCQKPFIGGNYSISEISGSSGNYTGPSYRNLSSVASSSLMSENTQQTTISCQKSTTSPLALSNTGHSSGSGSGVPRLIQKTVAREIELKSLIGKGRYTSVYYGMRQNCEPIAVKTFWSQHRSSWAREIDIHGKYIVRHENIITYFGADIVSVNGSIKLWLVTEYHPLGSLYDYLQKNPINNLGQMLNLMKSIICGLEYLHSSVPGRGGKGKPIIAHRDLKSKNILMKSPHNCCISDFSLAVTKSQGENINIDPNTDRTSTVRYMAPEVLTNELNCNSTNIEDFLRADMYSLALVFWETFNRLPMSGRVNEYQEPYEDCCPYNDETSIYKMIQIVCEEKRRPWMQIPQEYDPILSGLIQVIQECWSHNPKARLSSLLVKKRIINFKSDLGTRYPSSS